MQVLDPTALAASLESNLRAFGLHARIIHSERDLYVELTKGGAGKSLPGYNDPVTIRIARDEGSTTITVGRSSWGNKALSQKVGSVVFLPLTFSRSSGLVQDKTLQLIWQSVDSYIDSTGHSVGEIVIEGHGQAIEPRLFGGRSEEVSVFRSKLQSTIDGHARNIAITGEHGIGKSSLLRKFEEIAREKNCLTVRRELDPTIATVKDLANFILEAFRSEAYSSLSTKTEAWDKTKDFFRRRSFSVIGPGVGSVSVGAPTEAATFVQQESFFKESMRLWFQLRRNGATAIVFLLDEATQIQNIEGGWRFLKSVFTRLSEAGSRFMLVVSGDLDFSKEAGSNGAHGELSHSPIERYLQPLNLKEMVRDETSEVLNRTVSAKNCSITTEAKDLIFELSGGNPYDAQNIITACLAQNPDLSQISAETVENTHRKGSAGFSNLFTERIDKCSDQERGFLFALSSFKEPVSQKQLSVKLKPSVRSSASVIANNLTQQGLVRLTPDRKLKLSSPLLRDFIIEISGKKTLRKRNNTILIKRSGKSTLE